jgi:hypothetical protein
LGPHPTEPLFLGPTNGFFFLLTLPIEGEACTGIVFPSGIQKARQHSTEAGVGAHCLVTTPHLSHPSLHLQCHQNYHPRHDSTLRARSPRHCAQRRGSKVGGDRRADKGCPKHRSPSGHGMDPCTCVPVLLSWWCVRRSNFFTPTLVRSISFYKWCARTGACQSVCVKSASVLYVHYLRAHVTAVARIQG